MEPLAEMLVFSNEHIQRRYAIPTKTTLQHSRTQKCGRNHLNHGKCFLHSNEKRKFRATTASLPRTFCQQLGRLPSTVIYTHGNQSVYSKKQT